MGYRELHKAHGIEPWGGGKTVNAETKEERRGHSEHCGARCTCPVDFARAQLAASQAEVDELNGVAMEFCIERDEARADAAALRGALEMVRGWQSYCAYGREHKEDLAKILAAPSPGAQLTRELEALRELRSAARALRFGADRAGVAMDHAMEALDALDQTKEPK